MLKITALILVVLLTGCATQPIAPPSQINCVSEQQGNVVIMNCNWFPNWALNAQSWL